MQILLLCKIMFPSPVGALLKGHQNCIVGLKYTVITWTIMTKYDIEVFPEVIENYKKKANRIKMPFLCMKYA